MSPASPFRSCQYTVSHGINEEDICTLDANLDIDLTRSCMHTCLFAVDFVNRKITAKCPREPRSWGVMCPLCTVLGLLAFTSAKILHTENRPLKCNMSCMGRRIPTANTALVRVWFVHGVTNIDVYDTRGWKCIVNITCCVAVPESVCFKSIAVLIRNCMGMSCFFTW